MDAVEPRHGIEDATGQPTVLASLGLEPAVGERRAGRAEAEDGGEVLESARGRARSCSLPTSRGARRRPRRTRSAPGAGGPSERVGAHREQIGAQRPEVDRDVADGLRRVDVDEHTSLATACHDLPDRLEGADLVVAPLEVHHGGVVAHRGQELVDVDVPDAVGSHDRHLAEPRGLLGGRPSAPRRWTTWWAPRREAP
ncbi:MAG: hypothetical protein U5R31_03655 [Acidimicrobiia bacterium]|nr:hypothetical protein [Acidimicrobiia bacterium]